MYIIITLTAWKLKTSTRHHHSFISFIAPHITQILTPANITRNIHVSRVCQNLYCFLRGKGEPKTWSCAKRQCKAISATFDDNFFTTEHLHEPHLNHSEQIKVLEKKWRKRRRIPGSSHENLYKMQQLRANVQWYFQITKVWPEAFKDKVTQRYWRMWLLHCSYNWHCENQIS